MFLQAYPCAQCGRLIILGVYCVRCKQKNAIPFNPITPWHEYSEQDYISIWGWMHKYESTKATRILSFFTDVVLRQPIINHFSSETFSYILDYAMRFKDLDIDGAYLIFSELKRRLKYVQRLNRYPTPKGVDPRKENR